MKPKLIIFDNDGVLIDSELVWHRVNAVEMTRLGFPITVEKSIEYSSNTTKDEFEKLMFKQFGKTLSNSDAMSINIKAEELYETELSAIADITKVLAFLEHEHINKCIASNGDNEYVNRTLFLTKLDKYFKPEHVFTAAMVKNRKPAPDVFLQAAKYFNVDPKDCLVIEDHILGIAAAKVANMPVIGFLGASHLKNSKSRELILKANPTIIVNDALQLLDALRKLL